MENIDLTEKKLEHFKIKHQEQFWGCKFTSNSNLSEKSGKLKIKNIYIKFFPFFHVSFRK